jgi:hypothetical protein
VRWASIASPSRPAHRRQQRRKGHQALELVRRSRRHRETLGGRGGPGLGEQKSLADARLSHNQDDTSLPVYGAAQDAEYLPPFPVAAGHRVTPVAYGPWTASPGFLKSCSHAANKAATSRCLISRNHFPHSCRVINNSADTESEMNDGPRRKEARARRNQPRPDDS